MILKYVESSILVICIHDLLREFILYLYDSIMLPILSA